MHKAIRYLICLFFIGFTSAVAASEFRSWRPILTPSLVPENSRALQQSQMKPVSRQLAEKAVQKLIAAWNGKNLDGILGKEFYDKSRLNDAMNGQVPRDAALSLLAIQDTQTLQQQVIDTPGGKILVSMVSITAKTQLTFNDPTSGYQRREGVNEYIMRIKQRAL